MIRDGEEAYVIGSPFKQEYWDTTKHLITDLKREGGPKHDLSIKLEGGSVQHVEEFFIELWNYISKQGYQGKGMLKIHPPTRIKEKFPVQITRSITPGTFNKSGELGIFEGYRKAIAKAEQFIYLENQYFTNNNIVKALKNALKANRELQIIVVINENPDIPTYKNRQEQCMKKLGIESYEDALNHPQIGFFTLWSTGWKNKQLEIQRIYVHTKLAIVDDLWATLGTANLDGSSLTHVNELKGLFDRKFHRNMEINVLMPELGEYAKSEVQNIRNNLWNEHLGCDVSNMQIPSEGWLQIWQEIAQQNIKSLNHKKPSIKGQILPYSTETSAENQLEDMKIKTELWEVIE
jgi:phosphatidylserine/phosphatidylglycerophosphate/cardiolipin synthase-like enzyme